jgi:hypothetical protein
LAQVAATALSVVTVEAADQPAAVAVALAVVSDAGVPLTGGDGLVLVADGQ